MGSMRQPDPTFRLRFPPWTGRHRQSFRAASRAGLRITGVGSLLWCSHVSDRINNLRETCEGSKTALIALGRVPEGMEEGGECSSTTGLECGRT
jgi:hypothetical protein